MKGLEWVRLELHSCEGVRCGACHIEGERQGAREFAERLNKEGMKILRKYDFTKAENESVALHKEKEALQDKKLVDKFLKLIDQVIAMSEEKGAKKR